MNKCRICQKDIHYPEGVYLKKGAEVHIKCLQEKRKMILEKNINKYGFLGKRI